MPGDEQRQPADIIHLSLEETRRVSPGQLNHEARESLQHITHLAMYALAMPVTLNVGIIISNFVRQDTMLVQKPGILFVFMGTLLLAGGVGAYILVHLYKHRQAIMFYFTRNHDWSTHFGDVGEVKLIMVTEDDGYALHMHYTTHREHLKEGIHEAQLDMPREVLNMYLTLQDRRRHEGEHLSLGLWHEHRLIGSMTVDTGSSETEFSYSIIAGYQGKGYITRTLVLLRDYIFTQTLVERLIIRCEETNTRSVAVATRAGFRKAGHVKRQFHTGSRWLDTDYYHLFREEWEELLDKKHNPQTQ